MTWKIEIIYSQNKTVDIKNLKLRIHICDPAYLA